MIIWIALVLFIIFVYLVMGELDSPEKKKKYLMIAGGFLALVMALRGDHGGKVYDFRVYIESFELIAKASWSKIFEVTEFEQGFVVLCKLLSYISKEGQTLVIFQSLFCVYAVCRFIYKNTDNVFAAFFFFVTLGTMGFMLSGIRQAIAIAFILLSVEPMKEKKFLPFLIFVLLAASVHSSAIVFVFSYFYVNSNLLQKHKLLSLIIPIILFSFADKLINFGASVIYEEEWAVEDAAFSFNGIVNILIYAVSAVYQFIRPNKLEDKSRQACLGLSMLGVCIYLMRFFAASMERIALYFVLAIWIGLADFYTAVKKGDRGLAFCAIIIMLCMVLFLRRMGNADYGNYVFFWR